MRSGPSPLIGTERGVAWFLLAAGALATGYEFLRDPARGYGGLLVAGLFGVLLSLGAAVFIAVHAVGGARRWEPIREWPMALAGLLPLPAAAVAVVIFAGRATIFPWADADVMAHSEILQAKAAWFETPFILSRTVVVLVAWLALVAVMRARLAEHITRATAASRARLARVSALFLVALAPTLSVAGWDWSMGLEPEWFSTMYGVYYFAGAFLTAIAAVAVLLPLDLQHAPTPAHRPGIRHDVGKLLFAFAAFWAYIWYCQYMLIWYADIPEEATYFALRQSSPWVALFWLNPILNFGVPFVVLLSAAAKQRPRLLQHVALIVLLGRWLDVYLLVAPPVDPDGGMAIGAIGASLALFAGMALLYPPSRSSAVEAVPQEAAGRALLAD